MAWGEPDAASVSRRRWLEQLHDLEHRALGVHQVNTTSDVGDSDLTLLSDAGSRSTALLHITPDAHVQPQSPEMDSMVTTAQ